VSEGNNETEAMQIEDSVNAETDVTMREASIKRNYTLYTDQDKVRFFKLLFEKCLSASAAAKQLGIHVRTAQRWTKQYERDPDSIFEKCRKTGRPRLLNEEHKKVILDCIDKNPSAVLEQVMEQLRQVFTGLKVSKSTVHDFVRNHCNLSLKKAQFQPVDRNSEEKIKERLDWIRKWEKTDMDFTKNCVFLDESAFHINMKRSMAWSKKGSPAVVKVPKTRAQTTTILGAISAAGLIKCSLRLPQPPANKKRKRGDDVVHISKGTVTGHYISFLKATMDEMDQYPHMKGHCLVMDNAPIHTSEDIAKYIASRGSRCAYLPSYSPELNPIEQFWSVVKSKVKRNKFLEKETLMTRISKASNSLRLSDFEGFVWHSYKCLDKCRNREQL
jgi:transposase